MTDDFRYSSDLKQIFNDELFIYELQNSTVLRLNKTSVIYNDFTTIKVSIFNALIINI